MKIGMSNTKRETGMLTMQGLANEIGEKREVVERWVVKHNLKCTKKITRKIKQFYFIDIPEFWEWAEQHKHKVNFLKIERNSLLPEPSWVEGERKKAYGKTSSRKFKHWTDEENDTLINLVSANLSYEEIEEKIGREPRDIAEKRAKMRKKGLYTGRKRRYRNGN